LLISEYQINPFIYMSRNIVRFKGCTHFEKEVLRGICPFRKDSIID